jgi:hypothetical protein
MYKYKIGTLQPGMFQLDIDPESLESLEYIGISKNGKLKDREKNFVNQVEDESEEPSEDFEWFKLL